MNLVDRSSQPTSVLYIWRGILYALLSAVALYCGFVLSSHTTDSNNHSLLVGFFVACFPFFIAYTATFPRNETLTSQEPRATFAVMIGFSLVVVYAVVSRHQLDTGQELPLQSLLSLGAVVLLFWSYGGYLLWQFDKLATSRARHQLVWSVLFAIGIMLYVGITFPALQASFVPILPLLLIVSSMVFSEVLRLGRFATLWTSLAHAALALIVLLSSQRLSLGITTFFACVAVSAYLAVFEAWSATSEEVQRVGAVVLGQETLAGRYFNGTLLALIISGSALPMLYVFTSLSPWFLLFLGVHIAAAFLVWFAARSNDRLISWPWRLLRITFGAPFLVALAADSRFFYLHPPAALPLPKSPLLYALLATASAPVLSRLPQVFDDWRDRGLAGLLSSASRFLGVVFYLAAFGVGISILLYSSPGYPAALTARATHTCTVYFAFWLLSGIYIARKFFQKPPTSIAGGLIAVLAVTRIVTSCLIGGVIVALALAGGDSLSRAMLTATPLMMAAMGGFALNDYCDRTRDQINRPYRPLPSGRLRPITVRSLGILLLVMSAVISLFACKSITEFVIVFLGISGAAAYNLIVVYAACLKNIWTGMLCSLPLIWFAAKGRIDWTIIVIVFIYVTGRELLMDVVDLPGDEAAGVRAIPWWIGPAYSSLIGFSLIVLSGLSFSVLVDSPSIFCLMMFVLVCALISWTVRSTNCRKVAIYLLWLPMLIGVISFYRK